MVPPSLIYANGIGFTVDQGTVGGAGTYLINGNSTQTWTFSEPVVRPVSLLNRAEKLGLRVFSLVNFP